MPGGSDCAAPSIRSIARLADVGAGGVGSGPALVVHHHAGPSVEHPRRRHTRCAPGHWRPVPVLLAPELCRRGGRGNRAAIGAQRMDHRTGVHGAQRCTATHAGRRRELRPYAPETIEFLVAGGGPARLATATYWSESGLEVGVI